MRSVAKNFLGFFLFLVVILGCPRPWNDNRKDLSVKPFKRLRWAVARPPQFSEWNSCKEALCWQHSALVMEGLVHLRFADSGVVALPSLAATWNWETDRKLIFKLRSGIQWSDGVPLRPSHFLLGWKRALSAGESKNAALFFPVVNAKAFSEGKAPFSSVGFEARGEDTIVVTLSSPFPQFTLVFGHPAAWPYREHLTKEIGLGPFLFDRKLGAMDWRYRKNPSYYRGPVSLDEIEIKYVPSATARVHLFLNDEVDFVDDLPNSDLPPLLQSPALYDFPSADYVALAFNPLKKPFSSVAGRQAFQMAVNKEEWRSLLKWPNLPAASLSLLGEGASPPHWARGYQPELARERLNAAKSDSFAPRHGEPLTLRPFPRPSLAYPRSSQEADEIAHNLQAQWLRTLDIKTELSTYDSATKFSALGDQMSQPSANSLYLVSFSGGVFSRWGVLESWVASGMVTLWKSKIRSVDAAIKKISDASTETAWKTAVASAEALLVAQESLIVPLYFETKTVLRNTKVRRIVYNPIEIWDFRDTTID